MILLFITKCHKFGSFWKKFVVLFCNSGGILNKKVICILKMAFWLSEREQIKYE